MARKVNEYSELVNYRSKNHQILVAYWVSIAAVTFLEIFDYIVYQFVGFHFEIENYFIGYLVIPVALNISLGLIYTFVYRMYNQSKSEHVSYMLMAGFVILCDIVICIHYGVSVVYVIYVVPIFLSIVYNNRRLTQLVAVLCVISYATVLLFLLPSKEPHTYKHDYMDMTATIIVIIISLFIGTRLLAAYSHLIDKVIAVTIKKTQLEHELKLDSLTNLFNHATFYQNLDSSIKQYNLNNQAFSIIIIDIDNFKKVNDTYGHFSGDQIILGLVDVINRNISQLDLAHRYGGEEFAIIVYGDTQCTMQTADKIRRDFSNESFDFCKDTHFTISLGICEYTNEFAGRREFFSAADKGLYDAKNSGKNKVVIANSSSGF